MELRIALEDFSQLGGKLADVKLAVLICKVCGLRIKDYFIVDAVDLNFVGVIIFVVLSYGEAHGSRLIFGKGEGAVADVVLRSRTVKLAALCGKIAVNGIENREEHKRIEERAGQTELYHEGRFVNRLKGLDTCGFEKGRILCRVIFVNASFPAENKVVCSYLCAVGPVRLTEVERPYKTVVGNLVAFGNSGNCRAGSVNLEKSFDHGADNFKVIARGGTLGVDGFKRCGKVGFYNFAAGGELFAAALGFAAALTFAFALIAGRKAENHNKRKKQSKDFVKFH